MLKLRPALVGTAIALSMLSSASFASCGSAFCVLNTSWDMQEASTVAGSTRVDLRYEYIKQDQLRRGTDKISEADAADEEALEQKTDNRNWLATVDYSFDPQWSISVALPFVSRNHSHIEDPSGAATPEQWDFSELSDARVIGRYNFPNHDSSAVSYGLQLGVKLPTGSHTVKNDEGVEAERSLQPGTGTTDVIVGGYFSYRPKFEGASYFAQANYQTATAAKDDFKPGNQLAATGGLRYPISSQVSGLFQLNWTHKESDSGSNSEPDVSGSTSLFASPGVAFAVTRSTQLYVFAQAPLYQKVTGIQLTADTTYIAGVSTRF